MKKIIPIIVLIFVLVPFFSAFADEAVDSNVQATSAYDAAPLPPTSSNVGHKAAKRGPSEVSKLSGKVQNLVEKTQNLTTATQANTNEVAGVRADVKGLTTAVDNNTETLKNLGGKVDTVYTTVAREFKNLGDQNVSNTQIIVGSVVLAVLILGVLIWRNRNSATEAIQPVVAGNTAVLDAVNALRDTVNHRADGIEDKVDTIVAAVAFDSRPFDVTVGGHRTVFTQSPEATAVEIYQILEVEAGVDPTATAKDHELQTTRDRNVAYDKNRKVAREYHNGALKKRADAGDVSAKLTIEIFEYLRDVTKQITVTKL